MHDFREVVDETDVYDDYKYSPVHLRPSLINSTDETVMKYLIHWPWKQAMCIKRTASARSSKVSRMKLSRDVNVHKTLDSSEGKNLLCLD